MIRIEKADRSCNCCLKRGEEADVAEIMFIAKCGGVNASTIALCKECRNKLKVILEGFDE